MKKILRDLKRKIIISQRYNRDSDIFQSIVQMHNDGINVNMEILSNNVKLYFKDDIKTFKKVIVILAEKGLRIGVLYNNSLIIRMWSYTRK